MISPLFKICLIILCTIPITLFSQSSNDSLLPEKKRLVSKVEIFAGPNLSFNHGNKFIENYNDENVTNKRLMKFGYLFGIGACHSISNRVDLNVRLQYELKGTKNELNTPSLTGGRIINIDNYTYKYLTIQAMPQITIGKRKNFLLSLGLYYSIIKGNKGSSKLWYTNGTTSTEGSFEGRYFYDLRDDGIRQGFTWMPYLNGIENHDLGVALSIGYKAILSEKHIILFQLQDNYGLQNINKDNPYGLIEKNHSIALIISYNFQFSPKKYYYE